MNLRYCEKKRTTTNWEEFYDCKAIYYGHSAYGQCGFAQRECNHGNCPLLLTCDEIESVDGEQLLAVTVFREVVS